MNMRETSGHLTNNINSTQQLSPLTSTATAITTYNETPNSQPENLSSHCLVTRRVQLPPSRTETIVLPSINRALFIFKNLSKQQG